jgi:hypothetical protein
MLVKIPKKSGFRLIYVPEAALKEKLRFKLPFLENLINKYCDKNIVYGFCKNKNIVDNAKNHIEYRFTLNFDLKDFFDSVSIEHLYFLTEEEKEEVKDCFIDGCAYQGLPTSPAIANLAASLMDGEIRRALDEKPYKVVYTRYADDMTFSFHHHFQLDYIQKIVEEIVANHKFVLNCKKTRLQDALYGKREITGVYADYCKVSCPRRIKRKMRAALHNKNKAQYKGLKEFSLLKPAQKNPLDVQLEILKKFIEYRRGRRIFTKEAPFPNEVNTASAISSLKAINKIQLKYYIKSYKKGINNFPKLYRTFAQMAKKS